MGPLSGVARWFYWPGRTVVHAGRHRGGKQGNQGSQCKPSRARQATEATEASKATPLGATSSPCLALCLGLFSHLTAYLRISPHARNKKGRLTSSRFFQPIHPASPSGQPATILPRRTGRHLKQAQNPNPPAPLPPGTGITNPFFSKRVRGSADVTSHPPPRSALWVHKCDVGCVYMHARVHANRHRDPVSRQVPSPYLP